jgi:hypothetical protein
MVLVALRKGAVSSNSRTSPGLRWSRLRIWTGIVICPLEVRVAFMAFNVRRKGKEFKAFDFGI